MPRLFLLFSLILLLLTACGNNGEAVSLPIPDLLSDSSPGESQPVPLPDPVVQVTPTPPLPPTFTPDPMTHQGHLYLLPVSGANGRLQYIHIVRPGETLSSLSQLYGVNLADLSRVNKITDPNIIRVGTALVIPLFGE